MTELELLAPAKDKQIGMEAILCGADAVYIGAEHHGARQAAGNSVSDIAELCSFAHRFNAKVYVTLNTLIYNDELDSVRKLIIELYNCGVDALIVQDMAVLEMEIPPIPLHASTQCDIRSPEKAFFLQEAGFSQLVLPREMTLDEIREVRKATSVPLEAFVHGALCVCYSGDCRASLVRGGRSANRGECAQVCRQAFNLIDGEGKKIGGNKHYLSLRDMNRFESLTALAEAGISSFKIEGRLKNSEYVRNVTAAYSKALNDLISRFPNKYRRSSCGVSYPGFHYDLLKTFNRKYTDYFLHDPQPRQGELAHFDTPKHVGEPVGVIKKANNKKLTLEVKCAIANGDGLSFPSKKGNFIGFRANKVENNIVFPASPLAELPIPGTIVYRNYDKKFMDCIAAARSKREIRVDIVLRIAGNTAVITLSDERNCRISHSCKCEPEKATTDQSQTRKRIIFKTGNTIYEVRNYTDLIPSELFIPASILTNLRREAFSLLDKCAEATYATELRPISSRRNKSGIEESPQMPFVKPVLDMHDNISNSLAENFYRKHNSRIKEYALEIELENRDCKEIHVMTCRYCLRRELGACLKDKHGGKITPPVYLESIEGNNRYRLDFDCKNCHMNVIAML